MVVGEQPKLFSVQAMAMILYKEKVQKKKKSLGRTPTHPLLKLEKETKKYNFRQTPLQPKLDFLGCLCFFEPFPYPIVMTHITNRYIFA